MIYKSIKTERVSSLSRLYVVSIFILPILVIYASPIASVNIGEIWMFIFMSIAMIDMRLKSYKIRTNAFYWYIAYAFFSSLVAALIFAGTFAYNGMEMLERVLRDTFYFVIVLIFGSNYFHFNYAVKIMRKVAVVLSIYMLIQYLSYLIFNISLPNVIPFLKTTISGGVQGQELVENFTKSAGYNGYMRVAGFFAEPAICAQFLSIALLLELFRIEDSIKVFRYALLYTMAIIPTFSVNGYVALIICWGGWLFFNKQFKKKVTFLPIMFIILAIGVYFILTNEFTKQVFDRLLLLSDTSVTTGSSVLRVIRGPAFYLAMPLFFQIFGVGFGNFLQFRELYAITTIYETTDEYMNTNSYIMISAGIIGFLIYLLTLYLASRRKVMVSKMILLILVVFGFSSSIYSTPQFVIMLLFILYSPNKSDMYEIKYNNFA